MKTILAHLRKEWREQRWILLAIFLAIPTLTALGGWAFAFGPLDYGRFAPVFVAGAVALVVLALSTELFAAEGRRDGYAFLRRTPGALRAAWGAKTAFYLLASGAAFAWSALVILTVAAAFRGALAREEVVLALGDSLTPALTAAVVALGLWILMASTWIPRGAAAAGAALLLVALLATPIYLVGRAHPELTPSAHGIRWAGLGFVLVALLASAYGFLRGARFARHPWSAAWRALALLLVVVAPVYAYGAEAYRRWLDLWPQQPDVYVQSVWVSHEGRHAYLNVYRPGDSRRQGDAERRGMTRAFVVDLATGDARPMGPLGSSVEAPFDLWASGGAATRRGTVGLVEVYGASVDERSQTWWDAVRGVAVKTLPYDVRTPDLVELERAEMRRITPNRLPDGRPVWILARAMEHDEPDGRVVSVPLPPGLGTNIAQAGGWYGYDKGSRFVFADAEGRPVTSAWDAKKWEGGGVRLGPDAFLGRRPSARRDTEPWHVVTASTGEGAPAAGLAPEDAVLVVLSPTRLLVRHPIPREGAGDLRIVDPYTGSATALPMPPGAPERPGAVWVEARTPGGALVLALESHGVKGHVLLDPATGLIRAWTPAPAESIGHLVACIDDDSAIFLTDLHRLVRVRWGTSDRTLLFPR